MFVTVDGRNPAPVDMVNIISHYLLGFSTIPGGDRRISAINSYCLFFLGDCGTLTNSQRSKFSKVEIRSYAF